MAPEAIQGAAPLIQACGNPEDALEGAQTVLEALPESLALKAGLWARIGPSAAPGALLLTGSSSISLASIRKAAQLSRPLLGFHLFLPLERMQVVELVSEPEVHAEDLARAEDLAKCLDKRAVRVQDGPGYAASRMALAQGLEAMRLLETGVAAAGDLDALMVQGYGHPVGPLELSDRIGLDLRLAIAEGIHREEGDPRFQPPAILRRLVAEGRLGRKSGQGFHSWHEGELRP